MRGGRGDILTDLRLGITRFSDISLNLCRKSPISTHIHRYPTPVCYLIGSIAPASNGNNQDRDTLGVRLTHA